MEDTLCPLVLTEAQKHIANHHTPPPSKHKHTPRFRHTNTNLEEKMQRTLAVLAVVVGACEAGSPIFCGGIANIQCPKAGWECVPDPRSTGCAAECGGADCGGVCAKRKPGSCGGFAGLQCGAGDTCVDTAWDGCNAACGGRDCMGSCYSVKAVKECGGIAGLQCGAGETCMYRDGGCTPDCGGADCMGVCVKTSNQFCGGIAGLQCGAGYECFDVVDGCNAACGGRDCGGVCGKVQYTNWVQ
eukprot:TRINITY_DN207_c0_g1_i10.p1 TRINITY_DN207_c0_g1~~TRINITY_DN207_c0_g1_i10.p1  ORF type:complete len:243 (+),score=75.51 TRINITY_DN207_c0_g1_i10:365-1093(+)